MSEPKSNDSLDPKDAPKKVDAKVDRKPLDDEALEQTTGGWSPKLEKSPDKFDPLLVQLRTGQPLCGKLGKN